MEKITIGDVHLFYPQRAAMTPVPVHEGDAQVCSICHIVSPVAAIVSTPMPTSRFATASICAECYRKDAEQIEADRAPR